MGIFNRAIPNIQTNNLNQVRVVPQEDYYVDDIFDPLFNAKVKEQLREKYGSPLLGTIGGYMEGIDNALMGQNEQWGMLGPGMGILSGFGRSMDKAGDFIIGGLTEGVKFATGQGFENPLRNIFVEDEDYSGTRLLAAMGNSMAGLAQAPKLNESDFKGMWNIPAMGAELMTDPGILGIGMMKAGKTISLKNQVAGQNASSKLSDIGKLLNDYDNFMAKVSIDLTAPGLRLGAKSLLDKIHQALGHSSARGWANTVFNSKESPEARMQAQEHLQNDPSTRSLLEMADEVTAVDDAIVQAETAARTPNLNDAQIALGMETTVPATIEEASRRRSKEFADLVANSRKHHHSLIRKAYFEDLKNLEDASAVLNTKKEAALDSFRKRILYDDRRNSYADQTALNYARVRGLLNTGDSSLFNALPEDVVATNFANYEALQKAYQNIKQMSKDELHTLGINPEYVDQVSLDGYDAEDIAAGLFYEFTPNESARNAIMRAAGVDYNTKGLQLDTPFTLSPSDYAGRSDESIIEGLKVSEIMLSEAFESAGIPLRNFKHPDDLNVLLDINHPQGSLFSTAFPNPTQREHLVSSLKTLLFPEQSAENLKQGAISYLNRLNDFSNEIIAHNKLRNSKYIPLYTQVIQQADTLGVDPLEYISKLKDSISFTDWEIRNRYNSDFIDDISALENLYEISEDRTIVPKLLRGAELGRMRQELYSSFDEVWDTEVGLAEANLFYKDRARSTARPTHPHNLRAIGYDNIARMQNAAGFPEEELLPSYAALNFEVQQAARDLHKTLQLSEAGQELFRPEVDRIFRQHLSNEDLQALALIDSAHLHSPENVFQIVKDLDEYDSAWQSLISEYELANNSLQGSLWHNLNDMADAFQRDVYNPLHGRLSVGYTPSGLEFKDTGAHAVDIYGRKMSTGGKEVASYDDLLNEKHQRGERIAAESARKEWLKTHPKSEPNYDSKSYKDKLKSDFGKRNIGYSGSDADYHTHRIITDLFRVDPSAFKTVDSYIEMRDIVLPRIARHYEVKLKPKFFFDVPSSTRRKAIPSTSLPEVSKFILKEGDEIVAAFNKEVKPVAEALLRDNVIPWTDPKKFVPKVDPRKPYKNEAWVKRVLKNQEKMQHLLGYSNTPHQYARYFEQIRKRISVKELTNKETGETFYCFVYPAVNKAGKSENVFRKHLSTDFLTLDDYVGFQNAKLSSSWKPPIKVPNVRSGVQRILGAPLAHKRALTPSKGSLKKSTQGLSENVVAKIQEAPAKEAAEIIDNFPTHAEVVEAQLMEELGVPEYARRVGKPTEGNVPPEGSKTPPTPSTPPEDIVTPPHFKDLRDLIHGAMAATSNASTGSKASLRTDYVRRILDDADLLMSKEGITPEDIATYKQAQVYLSGASIPKEEFIDTLASSGMVLTAYKPHIRNDRVLKAFTKNVAEINVAMKSNVLKVVQFKLPNGNSVVGAMWDTDNSDILNVFKKNYKNLKSAKLVDVVRLPKGELSSSVSEYLSSPKYRKMDEFFDRIRQQEGEYAKILGFTYDDARHVKNVRNMNPDTANYLANIVYKDLPVDDLDTISDKMIMELDAFKHLRGAWGTRKYDKRFLGQIEDFEMDGIRIFEDDASKIVRGSLGEGSFNNANFQLYVDLVYTDNFKLKNYASTPEDVEKIFNAKLTDGSESGNMQNLVLAAPRFNADGRIVGFTQYDKTTRGGLMTALNNPDTVLLPAHVFSPLDKVLRKDAKMSNKVYAFITRHITNPFKLGVLMNPGFLIGNANDAFLKQATAMAHKYNTSVPEEVANVTAAVRDVYVLNNKFDDAYRRFLVHIQSEGFAIAPSNQISSMAATDPRIRKMLKSYVNGKLQKGAGQPFIDCSLSKDERGVVKLWLMLNSSQTAASFDKGLQDLDVLAKSKNASKYQINKDPVSRILMGKGEYVSDDFKTWGLFSNPLVRKTMDISELTENTARAATILNDFRHKGMDADWFKDYFDTLEELKEAAKTNPKTAEFRENIKKQFSFDMSESLNTMHNANFDYERMTDFTDMVGTYVPFPTFFLKNLAYWLDVLVNHPQYIDRAITVQESLWGSRDTSEDKFAAEAKGRGAVPVNAGGQNLSNFFKGIFKPTPLQSMFGAFSLINNPVDDVYYRLHPLLSGGITAATQQGPLQPIAADLLSDEDIKYRPYSTDMYERNVTRDDPNFNSLEYAIHRLNPLERTMQSAIRLPDKLREGDVQLSDFSPSLFQPDFGEKYVN